MRNLRRVARQRRLPTWTNRLLNLPFAAPPRRFLLGTYAKPNLHFARKLFIVLSRQPRKGATKAEKYVDYRAMLTTVIKAPRRA